MARAPPAEAEYERIAEQTRYEQPLYRRAPNPDEGGKCNEANNDKCVATTCGREPRDQLEQPGEQTGRSQPRQQRTPPQVGEVVVERPTELDQKAEGETGTDDGVGSHTWTDLTKRELVLCSHTLFTKP